MAKAFCYLSILPPALLYLVPCSQTNDSTSSPFFSPVRISEAAGAPGRRCKLEGLVRKGTLSSLCMSTPLPHVLKEQGEERRAKGKTRRRSGPRAAEANRTTGNHDILSPNPLDRMVSPSLRSRCPKLCQGQRWGWAGQRGLRNPSR